MLCLKVQYQLVDIYLRKIKIVTKKNYSTVGRIPKGGYLENVTNFDNISSKSLILILNRPDYTTVNRIKNELIQNGINGVNVIHAGKIEIPLETNSQLPSLVAKIEQIEVKPDYAARIVINERTGTIVAGSNIRIAAVNISQGNLVVKIDTNYSVSQPTIFGIGSRNTSTQVVPETELKVNENSANLVELSQGATVANLVNSLRKIRLSTRDIITVIQAIKDAGALNADLIIQ